MKKILIDVDDVICDNGFMYLVNDYLGTNYTLDDVTTYYVEEELMTEEQKLGFYKYLEDKNPYDHSFIFDGAYDALTKLNETHDIYICSSCAIDIPGLKEASGMFYKNKYDFLIQNFPFLNVNKFIFTGCKNIFNADVQIDDRLSHLQNNTPVRLLFTSYHNKEYSNEYLAGLGVKRVDNWEQVLENIL